LFGSILKLKNILDAFDDFLGNEILDDRTFQDYQSHYLNLYEEIVGPLDAEKESIIDDLVFEIELIKSVEINVDYILMLVEEYLKKKGQAGDQEIRDSIQRAVSSSPSLRSKKDLIDKFVDSVSTKSDIGSAWINFVEAKMCEDLDRIIRDESLHSSEAKTFVKNAFRDGVIPKTGTAITKILPPTAIFGQNNNYAIKKQAVLNKLERFFERFYGLID
ncbi:MAG: type I restriction endonuclease subunit R, partial [Rhodothermaceae bacterium]|nr:type I restriction endonuclease subunit R [Rhodothermaceae bacterium]